jgi:hypothetical protein
MTNKHLLQVFLCHSSQDKPKVRGLYKRLQEFGVEPWLDEESLIPGQKWELEIPKAVKASHVVLICLSNNSINKEGYIQKEIKFALDVADEKPESTIFLIPVKLEQCEVPERLRKLQWVDLYDPKSYAEKFYRLQQALEIRAKEVGATIQPLSKERNIQQAVVPAKQLVSDFGKSLFQTKNVLCPYCLIEIRYRNNISSCPNCKNELPEQYIENFSTALPLFMQILGDSYSGKTVYLQTLYLTITNLGKIWPGFYSKALSTSTVSYQRDIQYFASKLELPPATQLGTNEPFIVLLKNMQRWGNRTLIIRDSAGELAQEFNYDEENLSYLLHIPTTFFMFSLSDLANANNPRRITDMLSQYIHMLEKMKIDPKFRNIVVVFSKADLLRNNLPSNIQEYILNDPLKDLISKEYEKSFDVSSYIENVLQQSHNLRDWVVNSIPSGFAFEKLAYASGVKLFFSMVSSLGSEVPREYISVLPKPQRVIDPLLLALELNSRA